jgi:D-apionolactonase
MNPTENAVHTLVRDNGFGPFVYSGHEILQRLFVTVRDEVWQETPPSSWISTVDEPAGTIRVQARHTTSQLDVEWYGVLTVADDGRSGTFDLEAITRRSMRVCRLGLVILHPVDFMVGARITAEGPEGSCSLTISPRIAPQRIVGGVLRGMTPSFSRLLVERDGVGRLELELEGDLFELEDQRNWGDGSFKAYCTPLRIGFPRTLDANARIIQRLRWQFTPARPAKVTRDRRPELTLISGHMPSIGREWVERSTFSAESWDHLALDLRSSEQLARLPHRLELDPNQKLEISVADDVSRSLLEQTLAWMAAQSARIARLLIYGPGQGLPEADAMAQWRRSLASVNLAHVPLLAATRGYFAELNRASWGLESVADGVAFPHTSTVHGDDLATIIDNVTTIRDMAETARPLTRRGILGLAPLAFYYPRVEQRAFPPNLAAPWLAANLLQAAAAGASAITLDADVAAALCGAPLRSFLPGRGWRITLYADEQQPKLHLALLIRGDARHWLAVNLDERPVSLRSASLPQSTDPDWVESYRALVRASDLSVAPQSVRWFAAN